MSDRMLAQVSRFVVTLSAVLVVFIAMPGPGRAQNVTVGNLYAGHAGSSVTISATLHTGGINLFAAVQSWIAFDPVNTPIAAKVNGTPNCTVNSSINKAASFAFWPSGCSGTQCLQVRSDVYYTSTGQSGLIADGMVLYTCQVNISSNAPNGQYPLIVTGTGGSTTAGVAITTTGVNGQVTVF